MGIWASAILVTIAIIIHHNPHHDRSSRAEEPILDLNPFSISALQRNLVVLKTRSSPRRQLNILTLWNKNRAACNGLILRSASFCSFDASIFSVLDVLGLSGVLGG